MADKKDNSTFRQKAMLRQLVLKRIPDPVVMETHGGYGQIFKVVYADLAAGIVFEKDEPRAEVLARQRPGWAVYASPVEHALEAGAGAHLEINLLDLDPWGDPWPAIGAFFASDRPRPAELHVVVNDGLRAKVRMRSAWSIETMGEMIRRYGNDLFDVYLDCCREMMSERAAGAGYELRGFHGYYCGKLAGMTHYVARLTLA